MNGRTSRLVAAVAVVVLLAGSAPAFALPAAADGFLAGLWSTFADFWKSGGTMDPDGVPQDSGTTESGGTMDPDGAPTPAGSTESGGTMDPDGVPTGAGG